MLLGWSAGAVAIDEMFEIVVSKLLDTGVLDRSVETVVFMVPGGTVVMVLNEFSSPETT